MQFSYQFNVVVNITGIKNSNRIILLGQSFEYHGFILSATFALILDASRAVVSKSHVQIPGYTEALSFALIIRSLSRKAIG